MSEIECRLLFIYLMWILGLSPSDKILQDMIKEAPGQLNFTMFLSLFSDKLSGEYVKVMYSTRNVYRSKVER